MMNKALTLIELILATTLSIMVIAIAIAGYNFILGQINYSMRKSNLTQRIDYCLENIKLHCRGAINVDPGSIFTAGINSTTNSFSFEGERNILNITPNNLTDNSIYGYYLNPDLVLTSTSISSGITAAAREILLDYLYAPYIEFARQGTDEPNFLTVTITANDLKDKKVTVSKSEGIEFWYTDVAK